MAISASIARPVFNRQTLLKADNLSLAGLCVLAVLFGYLAFKPAQLEDAGSEADLIAKLAKTQSSVKRKSVNGLAWGVADDDVKLYDGDQIFTEKKSTATVLFNDGSEITVAENSLIKIEKKGGKTTIDMSKGFVSGKLEGGSGLTLKMGNTRVALNKGAEIQIKVDPNNKNNTKVSLIKGDATIESGKKTLELKKDQVLSVGEQGAKITQITLKPVLPIAEKRIDADESPTIFFKWESSSALEYRLIIARDSAFREIVTSLPTNALSATATAPAPGQYYWKVIGRDPKTGKTEETINVAFTVFKTLPPELLAPAPARRFIFSKSSRESESISFLWRTTEADSTYEFQLATTRDFKDPVQSRTLNETQLTLPNLDPGTYFWRVRVLGKNGSRGSAYSPVQDFSIDRAAPPSAPLLVEPADGVRQTPGQLIALKWQEVALANGYRVEIFNNENRIVSEIVRNTNYTWTPQNPGRYQWRVKAEDSFGRETPYSDSRNLVVDLRPPTLVMPTDRDNFVLTRRTIPIELTWTAIDRNSAYELQIAGDSNFKSDTRRFKLTSNNHTWNSEGIGTYFWRVRAIVAGIEDAPYSAVRQFTIKDLELLPPPRLLDRYYFRLPPPLLERTKIKASESPKDSVSNAAGKRDATTNVFEELSLGAFAGLIRVLDLMTGTSVAMAQTIMTTNGPVDIKWEAIPNAISYELEVAADAKFSRVLFKRKLDNPRFFWPDAKPGRYFIRASSIDMRERPGPLSRISELIVSYQPIKLMTPADETTLTLKPGLRDIELSWQPSSAAKRYTLEIAKTADFSKPLLTRQLDGRTDRFTANLDPGSYLWRIQTRYSDGEGLVASDPFRFTVQYTELPAPRLRMPADESILKHEGEKTSVTLEWQPLEGAESYELEVSETQDFSKSMTKIRVKGDTAQEQELKDGTYYWRVRGLFANKLSPNHSSIWSFTVKTKPSVPEWIKPDDGESISYKEPISPEITFAWQNAHGAQAYDLEIAQSPDFKQKMLVTQTRESTNQFRLKDGQYFARVRARRDDGELSAWSSPRSFGQARQFPEAPELVYPSDGQKVYRKKSLRLSWKQNDGFLGYRFVVAKDSEFKTIVKETSVEQAEQTISNLPKGKYFWYVEGEHKPHKLAIKSDIQMFTVTSPPDPGRAEKLRIQAGYAPSIISNTMVSQTIANSLAIAATNSFAIDSSYWFSQPVGIAVAYHRKSATLYSQKLEESSDQKALEYTPQHASILGRYRFFIGKPGRSFELHARGGYIYKSFYTYYPESRTAIGLAETGAHNLQLGLGGKIPFNQQDSIDSFFDYGRAIASSPTKITGGSNILFELGYHRHLVDRIGLGMSYRYGRATYDFIESAHQIIGTLQETTHSVIGAVEYGF